MSNSGYQNQIGEIGGRSFYDASTLGRNSERKRIDVSVVDIAAPQVRSRYIALFKLGANILVTKVSIHVSEAFVSATSNRVASLTGAKIGFVNLATGGSGIENKDRFGSDAAQFDLNSVNVTDILGGTSDNKRRAFSGTGAIVGLELTDGVGNKNEVPTAGKAQIILEYVSTDEGTGYHNQPAFDHTGRPTARSI